jgi:hypothetical protein
VDAGGGEAGIPITGGPFRPEELPAQAGVGEAGSYTPEQHDAGSAPVPLTEHAAVPSTDNPAAVPMTWDVPLTEHAAVPSTDPHTEVGRGEAGHPISDGPYKSEPLPSEVGRGEAGQGGPA